jgi:hypothetical protein
MALLRILAGSLILAVLGCLAYGQQQDQVQRNNLSDPPAGKPASELHNSSDLPPLPSGKSTVIGGSIRQVDGVRDQLTINVFGARGMKILFDERTKVYHDGQDISVHDLRPGDHVSVETMLDGTAIFARSIHMMSELPQGECQGQIVRYDRSRGELDVRDTLSPESIKLHVSSDTAIVREGQVVSPDLSIGTLVAVQFQADNAGHNLARKIAVLATPGSAFVFSGKVVFLDLRARLLVLVDPRDDKRYEITLAPSLAISREVHEGSDLTVTADFDGMHYTAQAIAMNRVTEK